MNPLIGKLTGTSDLTDQVIASDFLISAKSGIKLYSLALTEAATPEVRETLLKQLDDAIDTHERITRYMIENEMYHAYNLDEQIQLDIQKAEIAQNLPTQNSSFF